MKYKKDQKARKLIYKRLAEFFEKRAREYKENTFHVSDLLNPRAAYFRYTDPKPLNEREIGFFVAGLAHHFVVESAILSAENPEEISLEYKTPHGIKIIATPDILDYNVFENTPIEIKTSRKWTIPEEPDAHYVDQLACYCAIWGVNEGRIAVFYITPGRKWDGSANTYPELVVWKIKFDDEELKEVKTHLEQAAFDLREALRISNPDILPICYPSWRCGSVDRKGKAEVNCKWYHKCRPPARYPENNL